MVAAPLIKQMPQGATMIATDVASPFFTPIKLTFMVSLILSAPVILYQVWAFIAPALYKHERRLVVPLLVSSSSAVLHRYGIRLLCGLSAGIWLPCQYRAGRGAGIHRHRQLFQLRYGAIYGVSVSPLKCLWQLCCCAGWGLPRQKTYAKNVRMLLVGAFVVGMLLTPPDVFSQTLLAIPMYCLFEIGVFFSRFLRW